MTLHITSRSITSDITPYKAQLVDADRWLWRVSWLDTPVDQNAAVTAMNLAELAAYGVNRFEPTWPLAVTWARELGLRVDDAVKMAKPPVVTS